jgi:DNA-binding beta-propeller fold protein YncE
VDTLTAPGVPYRIDVAPDGRTAVVSNPEAEIVRLFDVPTHVERGAVRTNGTSRGVPVGGTISPDGRHSLIALQGTSEVVMIDPSIGTEVRRFPTGQGPDGIAVARRGGRS